MKELYLHEHKFYYDDNASSGAYFLQHHCTEQEARAFLDQAKSKGHIVFEDIENHHYKLTHNPDGTYGIERKIV